MQRWLITFSLSLVTIGLLFYFLARNNSLNLGAIFDVTPSFLVVGLLMALTDLSLRAARVALVSRQAGCRISFKNCYRIVMAVDFFAAITPSRIGGEVARVVGFMQAGLKTSQALIVAGFEALMDLGYLLVALPAFLILTDQHQSQIVQMIRTTIFTVILVALVPTLLAIMRESYLLRMVRFLRSHLPFVYAIVSRRGRIDIEAGFKNFRDNILLILRGPKWCLPLGVLLACSWWGVRFASLIWISRGLGFEIGLAEIFWPQFLLFNSVIYTPMPLSGGLFEASFIFFYKSFIPASLLPSAMLLWRFFTYYLFIFIGGVATTKTMWQAILKKLSNKNKKAATINQLQSVQADRIGGQSV